MVMPICENCGGPIDPKMMARACTKERRIYLCWDCIEPLLEKIEGKESKEATDEKTEWER